MKSNVLKLSLVIVRSLRVVFILLASLLVLFFISHLLGIPTGIQYTWTDQGLKFDEMGASGQSFGILTFYFIKNLLKILVTLLILSRTIKIIESIKNLKAFVSDNIIHFRKMSAFFVMLFLIDILSFLPFDSTTSIQLDVNLLYPICAITCLLLSEIFAEGNRLYEENRLTV